ncbi:MAG TPA: hypothetical protein VKR52_01280 [Terracidiphilus sp.]|nr:hypothetical protein [Terracidiphilus sp.]
MARSKDPGKQLAGFLAKYTSEVAEQAEAARNEMRKLYPGALELVYDNYNALAIGFSPTERASDAIFSIAVYPRWVSLFFLQAKGLPDPNRLLRGSGKVARHIVLSSPAMLHEPAVRELMAEAVSRAKTPLDPRMQHKLIIKSISNAQRSRRPAENTSSGRLATRAGKRAVSPAQASNR